MSKHSFFEEQKEQSLIKARIVEKYFWAWAKVIIPTVKKSASRLGSVPKIAYIDLFAGPGRYQDGSESTPIKILETAISDPDLREMLVSLFNDVDSNNIQSLQHTINSIPGINNLKHPPQIVNNEVGENIVKLFESKSLIPTLFFVDPWGYKGLSLQLINSVVRNWGCDCIFFFNYNRINMGLGNTSVEKHIDALFGKERADRMRTKLSSLIPYERELTIVEEISKALQEMGGRYVLPFGFKNESGTRTSHHLIFVSKNVKGYEIMKEIMAKESSENNQGVPSFEYNPATSAQPLLFELSRPLDELETMLIDTFSGKTLKMVDIYNQHHVGKRYIKNNYKTALRNLEAEGRIITDKPASKRQKRGGIVTFGDSVRVTFPPKQ